MAAGPQAPAAHRGARTAPTHLQGQGILLLVQLVELWSVACMGRGGAGAILCSILSTGRRPRTFSCCSLGRWRSFQGDGGTM
eukprot:4173730-Pyramimonas_sp.AAC.1